MRSTLNLYCLMLMLLGVTPAAWTAPNSDAGNAAGSISLSADALTYHAQSGDTLIAIARQFTGRVDNWPLIGKLNRIAKDSSIPIGTPIVIPAELLADEPVDAKVVAFSGQVTAVDNDGQVAQVAIGATLEEGMEIDTGNNGFISLSLPGDSRITLPSNTRVKLTKLRISRYFKSPRTELTLMRGQIESRVTPLEKNKGRFEIHTPLSVAGVRGTHFRVKYTEDRAATEVLEGTVATGTPGDRGIVMLPAGKGNVISANSVGAAADLLRAPRIIAPQGGFDNYSSARFALTPLANATAYHIQISTDREGQNIIAEARSPEHDIALNTLTEGTYFVHASAIDRQGLEGLPRTQEITIGSLDLPPAPGVERSDSRTVTLAWPSRPNDKYRLQVARDAAFTWLIHSQTATAGRAQLPRPPFGTYYARIQAVNADGSTGPFSAAQAFIVTDQWVINEGYPAAKDGRVAKRP